MQDHADIIRLMSSHPDLLDRAIIVFKRRIWASRLINTAQRQMSSQFADNIILWNEQAPWEGRGVILPVMKSERGDRDGIKLEMSGLWMRVSQGSTASGSAMHMLVPTMTPEDFGTARAMPASGSGYRRSLYVTQARRDYRSQRGDPQARHAA